MDHTDAIKNSEFWIQTKLEPENRFSRWYLYYIVQRGAGASQKVAEGRILASKIQNQNKTKLAAAKSSDGYLSLWLINQLEIFISRFEDISVQPNSKL